MWVMGTDHQELVDGRSTRWEKHNRRRRELIIDAAVAVIEDMPRGAEMHVAQIAERAGMARPAVYRHFADRAELDRAVRERIVGMLMGRLGSPEVLSGEVGQVIHDLVHTYVTWAEEHAALHHVAVGADAGESDSPIRTAIGDLVRALRPLVLAGVTAFGATLDADDEASVDLIIVGIIAEVVAVVRAWLERPERKPPAAALSRRLADSAWFQLDGHARARGAVIDPSCTLEELVERALEVQVAGSPT